MEDLIAVLPFGGTYDLVQLKGSTLRKAFEHSVRRYGGNTGEFLQVSGISLHFIGKEGHNVNWFRLHQALVSSYLSPRTCAPKLNLLSFCFSLLVKLHGEE